MPTVADVQKVAIQSFFQGIAGVTGRTVVVESGMGVGEGAVGMSVSCLLGMSYIDSSPSSGGNQGHHGQDVFTPVQVIRIAEIATSARVAIR